MPSLVEASAFEVGEYLLDRAEAESFVTAEFGYGRYPIIANQPNFFTGQRAYVGIEAGMRGAHLVEARAASFRNNYSDSNASFLLHNLGEGQVLDEGLSSDEHYEGDFEVETILPDGAADEVVASNVFCDPLIARDFGRTMKLLGEMSRLVTNEGLIVLRETLTPGEVTYIQDYTVKHQGLQIVDRATPHNPLDWENLELFYGTHHDWSPVRRYNKGAYYLFLAKAAQTGSAEGNTADTDQSVTLA